MKVQAGSAIPSPVQGRLMILVAAVLWSTSGAFTKVLRERTPLGLNDPPLGPLVIASCRVLFAGLVLLPLLRRRDLSFSPALAATAVSFALMNALFISAMALGSAANAILLQYTAPLWLYLASVWFLGESADARGTGALVIGLAGIGLIVWGGREGDQLSVVLLALGSGVTYAGVLIGLRVQRHASPVWLTVVNHVFGGLVLVPVVVVMVWWRNEGALAQALPTLPQVGWLVLFGALQMALPYWLVARGLRSVSPQEAGTLTLLEPLLNPVWAYLVSPQTERPTLYTLAGGACILGALAWRYLPARPRVEERPTP
jgi:drug/metabolite transporter (DMT)-like permease